MMISAAAAAEKQQAARASFLDSALREYRNLVVFAVTVVILVNGVALQFINKVRNSNQQFQQQPIYVLNNSSIHNSKIAQKAVARNKENMTTAFVYHVHIPKCGGRTVLRQLYAFGLSDKLNCDVASCCVGTDMYQRQVKEAFLATVNTNSTCKGISHESNYPIALRTRNLWKSTQKSYYRDHIKFNNSKASAKVKLANIPNERWYIFSLFANPVARFVSASKHIMRRKHCKKHKNMSLAVKLRMNHACIKHGYDRGQAFYYYDHAYAVKATNAAEALKNKYTKAELRNASGVQLLSSTVPVNTYHPYQELASNFDLIGVTHYMDPSLCILLHDVIRLGLVDPDQHNSSLFDVCTGGGTYETIQSTRKNEDESPPLTTLTLLDILRDWCYVDSQVYAQVLEALVQRLSTLNSTAVPPLYNAAEVIGKALAEQAAWQKVAKYAHDYKTGLANESETLRLLSSLSPDERKWIVPDNYGGWI